MKIRKIGQICAAILVSSALTACGSMESDTANPVQENGTEEITQQESVADNSLVQETITENVTQAAPETEQVSVAPVEFESAYNMMIGYWYDDSNGITYYVDSLIKDGAKLYLATKSNEPDNWYQLRIQSVSEDNNDMTQDQYYNYTMEMTFTDKAGNESAQTVYILEDRYNFYTEKYMYLVKADSVASLKMIPTSEVSMISAAIPYLQYLRPVITDSGEIALEAIKIENVVYDALDYLIMTEDGSPNTDFWLFNDDFDGYYCFKRKENTGTYLFDAYYEDSSMKDRLLDYYPIGNIEWNTAAIENPYMEYTAVELPMDVFSGYLIKNHDGTGYFYQAADHVKLEAINRREFKLLSIFVDDVRLHVGFMDEESYQENVTGDNIVPKYIEADFEVYANEKNRSLYMAYNGMYFWIEDDSRITEDILRSLAGCFSVQGGEDIDTFLQKSMVFDGMDCTAQLIYDEAKQSDFSSNGLSYIKAKYSDNVLIEYYFDQSYADYTSTDYDPNDPNTPTVKGSTFEPYYDYKDYEVTLYKNTNINEYEKMIIHKINEPNKFIVIYDTFVEYGDNYKPEHFTGIFESMYAQE